MGYTLAFDAGTTALKGVLLKDGRTCVQEYSISVATIFSGEHKEQDPGFWYSGFCKISRYFFDSGIQPESVEAIVLSGQMQDVIAVDSALEPVGNAILYSDGRAGRQADEIKDILGADEIINTTGNFFDGSIPLSKLLWIKQLEPERYAKIHKVLISSKDYIVARLTGSFVTDVTSASTSGMMDIRTKTWKTACMEAVGLNPRLLPDLKYPDELAGTVTGEASKESGYCAGTPVYTGVGDAGATTLASGICGSGEYNINLGTSGWVATLSGDVPSWEGVFNLAAVQQDLYINVVPFLNAGNVHKWISSLLSLEDSTDYGYIDRLLEQSQSGSNGVLFLPYISGERFPVMDHTIKGGFYGITPETSKSDLARSALEGVAFSIRQGMERIGKQPQKISLIGGGAKTPVWAQIFADILGHPVDVYTNSTYLPAMALASCVLVAQGKLSGYRQFIAELKQATGYIQYAPEASNVVMYNELYDTYRKLYPAMKQIGLR